MYFNVLTQKSKSSCGLSSYDILLVCSICNCVMQTKHIMKTVLRKLLSTRHECFGHELSVPTPWSPIKNVLGIEPSNTHRVSSEISYDSWQTRMHTNCVLMEMDVLAEIVNVKKSAFSMHRKTNWKWSHSYNTFLFSKIIYFCKDYGYLK